MVFFLKPRLVVVFSSGIYYAILGIVVFRIIRTGQTTSLKMESDVIS